MTGEGPNVRTKIKHHGGGRSLRTRTLHRGHRGTGNTGNAEEWAQRGRRNKGQGSIESTENIRGEERRCQRVARRGDAMHGNGSN